MCKCFGYVTVSKYITSVKRQEKNIKAVYPNITIINTELLESWQYQTPCYMSYTQIMDAHYKGDTLIYNSIVNLGITLDVVLEFYFGFLDRGVTLRFIQETDLNTDKCYDREVMKEQIKVVYGRKIAILEKLWKDKVLHNSIRESAKKFIKQYSKDFDGKLKDEEVMNLINITDSAYYKYKKELREQEDAS